MSIQINLDEKLSDEARSYLLSRGRRYLVLQNDRQFGPASSLAPQGSKQPEKNDEWERQVNELTTEELRDELSNRSLSTAGKQETLRKRLIEAGPED